MLMNRFFSDDPGRPTARSDMRRPVPFSVGAMAVSRCCPNYWVTCSLESMSLPLTGFLLSNCCLPRDFKLLRIVVHPDQCRRGLKWIVQPRPQIAIEEQLLPQQSSQRR